MGRSAHDKVGFGPVGTMSRTCIGVHVRPTPVEAGTKERRKLAITKELVLYVRALQAYEKLSVLQIAKRMGLEEQYIRRLLNPTSHTRWLPEREHLKLTPEIRWETWIDEVASNRVTETARGDGRANRSIFSNELVLYVRALNKFACFPIYRVVSHLQEDLKIAISETAVQQWLRGTSRSHLRQPTPADLSFPTTLKGHTYVPNHHLEEVQPQLGLAALAVREEP